MYIAQNQNKYENNFQKYINDSQKNNANILNKMENSINEFLINLKKDEHSTNVNNNSKIPTNLKLTFNPTVKKIPTNLNYYNHRHNKTGVEFLSKNKSIRKTINAHNYSYSKNIQNISTINNNNFRRSSSFNLSKINNPFHNCYQLYDILKNIKKLKVSNTQNKNDIFNLKNTYKQLQDAFLTKIQNFIQNNFNSSYENRILNLTKSLETITMKNNEYIKIIEQSRKDNENNLFYIQELKEEIKKLKIENTENNNKNKSKINVELEVKEREIKLLKEEKIEFTKQISSYKKIMKDVKLNIDNFEHLQKKYELLLKQNEELNQENEIIKGQITIMHNKNNTTFKDKKTNQKLINEFKTINKILTKERNDLKKLKLNLDNENKIYKIDHNNFIDKKLKKFNGLQIINEINFFYKFNTNKTSIKINDINTKENIKILKQNILEKETKINLLEVNLKKKEIFNWEELKKLKSEIRKKNNKIQVIEAEKKNKDNQNIELMKKNKEQEIKINKLNVSIEKNGRRK